MVGYVYIIFSWEISARCAKIHTACFCRLCVMVKLDCLNSSNAIMPTDRQRHLKLNHCWFSDSNCLALNATGSHTFYRWVLLEEPFQRCSEWASSQGHPLRCHRCQRRCHNAAENWTNDCSQSQHNSPATTTTITSITCKQMQTTNTKTRTANN